MSERAKRVFALLEEVIEALDTPPRYRDLLRVQLEVGRDKIEEHSGLPSVQLPLLVHEAIAGDEGSALHVAAACTVLYLGADLFDDLADGGLPDRWRDRDPAEANLAAATFLSALPQRCLLLLERQGVPLQRVWEIIRHFANALLTMGAGQHDDLLFPDRDHVSLDDCRKMIERKSGAEFGLFAESAALLATEDASTVRAYGAFAMCLGTAGQIVSDLRDIWNADHSQDLSNGKRTLPVVLALHMLEGDSRDRLRELLASARGSTEVHRGEVLAQLRAAGSIRYSALMVEVYRRRGQKCLTDASPRDPAGSDLRRLLDGVSMLPEAR